jgi:hypothetical protein
MPSDWKTITYRGGVIEFRLPATWVEEYEGDGGTFFEPTSGSTTLRLSVLTLRSPSPVTSDTPHDLLRPRAEVRGVQLVRLSNGNAMIYFSTLAEEDGIPIVLHHWEVANAVPPLHARLALFSLTTLASERTRASADLRWLDEEIRASRFSATLGEHPDN